MNHINYKHDVLHIEDVAVDSIADGVGTPFYCYSHTTIEENFHEFTSNFAGSNYGIYYAVKANSLLAVLNILGKMGAGAECVSEGEIKRALMAGIPASKIVFSGVGKTTEEILFALNEDIFQFNVESEAELIEINRLAGMLQKKAPVSIRVNPDVEVDTHAHITTGKKDNKFGIPFNETAELIHKASEMQNIEIMGVSVHIGSQILDLEPFELAFRRIKGLIMQLKVEHVEIKRLDLGGGLGISYNKEAIIDLKAYKALVDEVFGDLGCYIMLEPGRRIVGNAGILVSEVIYTKSVSGKHFVIIDAAMNDLMRQSLYAAHHNIIPVTQNTHNEHMQADIVGPICESSDIFAKHIDVPNLKPKDLLAILDSGAYGSSMSSNYNSRTRIAEIMVKHNEFEVIKERETFEDLIKGERIFSWN